jgi:hypothetical protein
MSARVFAEGTGVPVEKTRMDVERILKSYGATQWGVMSDEEKGVAMIAFRMGGASYRVELPMPLKSAVADAIKKKPPHGWYGRTDQGRAAFIDERHQQECRERWRAVLLTIKAKLEIVRIGASTVEREFMADMVLPNGATVGKTLPHIIQRGLTDAAFLALPESTSNP